MNNFKKVISITVLLILIFTGGALAQQFDDVPRDHWAYDSVQTLSERGYLSLYSGEDFNGEKALTRYEMAEIIANLLENTVGAASPQNLSEEDVDVIRELSLEFRDELVTVAQRQKDFEERLKNLENTNQIQNEDIANINVKIAEMNEDVKKVSNLEASVNEIDSQIKSLEEELSRLKTAGVSGQKLQEIEDSQSVHLTKINELENRIAVLEGEKTTKKSESDSSINTGFIIGGLAILALIL